MAEDGLRVDKWLWHARFCKSRSLAQKLCEGGAIDVNGRTVTKSHHTVRQGDTVTMRVERGRFEQAERTVRVLALGTRRGPAPEARSLYEEL
ncbi:MAG: RNA-binding S4 domain-containing protein [Alphaproteobacteria bacterium]